MTTDRADAKESARPSAPSSALLTFLVADVRGYTRFSAESGDHAAGRLSEVFLSLCREVISAHGGEVFGSAGDQALASFPSAHAALRAALAFHARLASEQETHPDLPLQAGIGLDAGEAVRIGGDYRGNAVNLAARLCSVAGAGETFASETVVAVARVVEGMVAVDRGEVQLKGLAHPVRVIQIAPEGELPDELPPLQPILVTHPNNLPDEPTPFIGRGEEISQITRLLGDASVRLVTLTGPGGTGKTRLALQVGNALLHDYHDGVFFVSLAPLSDPTLVPSAIAEVVGAKESGKRDSLKSLTHHLKEKQLLLVLDNFEHLLDASDVVSSLLEGCRELHVLVTSRIPLRLRREHEHAVPPLAVPSLTNLPNLATFSQYESVALFIERARAAKDSFEVTDDNAPAVAEICFRLDGLPLAIELAAARIKLFPPHALLERLSGRLQILTGGPRDLPERQRTLRGAIDWSYSLLTDQERTLFARLSVFAGGCTFEAADAVCNPGGELDLVEGMASLVDKSLLRQMGEEEPRFTMLETLREYAAEKLIEHGERQIGEAHARYYLQLVEDIAPELPGLRMAEWVARLDAELPNIRAAMAHLAGTDQAEEVLRLLCAFYDYWINRGGRREMRARLQEAWQRGGDRASPGLRGRALWTLGASAYNLDDGDAATVALHEALPLLEEVGDRLHCARAHMFLGNIASEKTEYETEAVSRYEEALRLSRELGWQREIAIGLLNLGILDRARGDLASAMTKIEEGLSVARAVNDTQTTSYALGYLGVIAFEREDDGLARRYLDESLSLSRANDDFFTTSRSLWRLCVLCVAAGGLEEAHVHLEEALGLCRDMDWSWGIAWCTDISGWLAVKQGRYDLARDLLHEGLRMIRELDHREETLLTLGYMAELSAAIGEPERAGRLLGAVTRLQEALRIPQVRPWGAEFEQTAQRVRERLGEGEWQRTQREGGAMSLSVAIAYGLGETV